MGRQEVVVAWRGTEFNKAKDLSADIDARRTYAYGGYCHRGILGAWKSVEKPVIDILRKLFEGEYSRLTLCGHSLGGGLATLNVASVVEHLGSHIPDMHLYTYGSASVGDKAFTSKLQSHISKAFRVVNNADTIPNLGSPLGYYPFGHLVFISEKGLWINPKDTSQHLHSKGKMDLVDNHSILCYAKLLESFSATVSAKWENEPDEPFDQEMITHKVHAAWSSYKDPDNQIGQQRFVLSPETGGFRRVTVLGPNTSRMCKILQDEFPGLEKKVVNLIEGEMSRLDMFFEGNTLDWPIFNLACFNIFLDGDEKRKEFNRKRTGLWTRFAEKDKAGSDYLPRSKVDELLRYDLPNASDADISDALESVKIDQQGMLHFQEYMLLHTLMNQRANLAIQTQPPSP